MFSRSSPSSTLMEHDSLENSRPAASEPGSSSAARHQDQNGWLGSGEVEGGSPNIGSGNNLPAKSTDEASGNVFEAVGRWSDAVRIMSASLDRDACGSLMNEISALQQEVASRRCTISGTTLRAFVDSPLPGLCLRVMGDLDQSSNSEISFTDHVSSILDSFGCIQDPANTGKQELNDALCVKKKELKDLCSQIESHQREREKIRSEQQELAEETMRDLESTTDCLLNLHSEKERIEQLLKEVRIKAAQQRTILEASLEKTGRSVQQVIAEVQAENMSLKDAEPVISGSVDRHQEKAQAVVSTVQDHINLVYRTADFVKEARTCIGGLVHSMMIKSLQSEVETLSQDKEHGEYLREHLREPPSGPPSLSMQRGQLTPSIASRYKSFYTTQLRNMTARHILSRFAAEGLILHVEESKSQPDSRRLDLTGIDSAADKDSEIVELSQQVLKKLDDLECLAVKEDLVEEIAKSVKGSTLALFVRTSNQFSMIAPLQCAAALEALASRPASAGRLVVRSTAAADDKLMHVCSLVLAIGSQGTVPAELAGEVEKEFRAMASSIWEALDNVLGGKCRNAVCVNHSSNLRGQGKNPEDVAKQVGDSFGCSSFSLCLSSFVGAVLQARMQYQHLSKIAIIDALEPFDTPHPCMKSAGIRLFPVSVLSEPGRGTAAPGALARNESTEKFSDTCDAECKAWRTALEVVVDQVSEFMPDLVLVSFRCFQSKISTGRSDPDSQSQTLLPRKLSAEDWHWAGKTLESLAGRICKGRLVVIWDLIGDAQLWHTNVTDLTLGMLPLSE